jgi:hypothetical protein
MLPIRAVNVTNRNGLGGRDITDGAWQPLILSVRARIQSFASSLEALSLS